MTYCASIRSRPTEYCIVIVEGASPITVGSLYAPFQFLKSRRNMPEFVVSTVSTNSSFSNPLSGLSVIGNEDMPTLLERMNSLRRPNAIFLCCGLDIPHELRSEIRRLIRACKRNEVRIASFGASTWLMAEEHAIPTEKCVVHWASKAAFSERHSSLEVTTNLFDSVGKVATCAGGLATLDFMTDFLAREFDGETAQAFCNEAHVSFPRQSTIVQPGTIEFQHRHLPKALRAVVEQMYQNIETPLPMMEIAKTHGTSQRQLERTFAKHLKKSPRRFYKDLQLDVARQLCEQTDFDLPEIAVASGFGSYSLLSRHFRLRFGVTPATLRKKLPISQLQT